MRRVLAAVGVAVVVAAFGSVPVHAADLGGFALLARAPGVQIIGDSADTPAPVHPALDATVPETFASLETGPVGHGLSSIVWPGPLIGNIGSAAVLGGAPDDAKQLNDPFRAETFAPQGPKDATYPIPGGAGSKMTSHADVERVESTANVSQLAATGVGTADSITSHSISTTKDGIALSEGTSKISGLVLAAGAITIDSVTSTARITSDGKVAKGKGSTTVSGLKIGGQPATVDQTGIHIGGQGNNPLGPINDALKGLAAAGIKAVLAAPIQEYKGPAGSFISGALVLGFGQGTNYMTVSLGGVQAMVDANEGVGSLLETPVPTPASEAPTETSTPAAPAGDTGASAAPSSDDGSSAVTTDASTGTSSSEGSGSSLASSASSGSDGFRGGLGGGLVFLAILLAIAAAVGMRRLSSDVLSTTKAAACVLERENR